MNHSTGNPTKYEAERIEAMLRLGCCCCAQLKLWCTAECQHIVEGNRLGHWYTLPICPGHHRGVWSEDQIEVIPPDLRVAISDGSKVFDPVYGTQKQLWIRVQERLKLPAIWPSSKILPRRGYAQVDPNTTATAADVVGQPVGLAVQVAPYACAESGSSARDGQEAP